MSSSSCVSWSRSKISCLKCSQCSNSISRKWIHIFTPSLHTNTFDSLKQWQTKCLLIAIWFELNLRFSLSDTNYHIQVPCEGHMQENWISEFCHWHRHGHRQPLTHKHARIHFQICRHAVRHTAKRSDCGSSYFHLLGLRVYIISCCGVRRTWRIYMPECFRYLNRSCLLRRKTDSVR